MRGARAGCDSAPANKAVAHSWGTYRNPLHPDPGPSGAGGPMEDQVTGGISPILGVGLDENTGLLLLLEVPSALPSLWSGFPSPSSALRPSTIPGLVYSLHPKPAHISTLHALATFPLLPGFLTLIFSTGAPPPRPGWEAGVKLSCFCSKAYGCFSIKKNIPSPPCLPHPRLCPTPRPPPPPCILLCPGHPHHQFSLASPTSIPSRIPSLWFLPPGQVLALGGLRDASGNLLLPGDSFVEPLSRTSPAPEGLPDWRAALYAPCPGGPQGPTGCQCAGSPGGSDCSAPELPGEARAEGTGSS